MGLKINRPKQKKEPPPEPRTISMTPPDYQPPKAEQEAEIDMPGASRETVRRAFFRPILGQTKKKEERS